MIDIHVHLFPDEIAQKTVEKLAATASIPHYGNGTLASLTVLMKAGGVQAAVNQPVGKHRAANGNGEKPASGKRRRKKNPA